MAEEVDPNAGGVPAARLADVWVDAGAGRLAAARLAALLGMVR